MGLISDLLGAIGGKKAPRTIADVEAALARLADERMKARDEVARAMRDRDELLLVDETDNIITDAIDNGDIAAKDVYRTTREHLEASRGRLDGAHAELLRLLRDRPKAEDGANEELSAAAAIVRKSKLDGLDRHVGASARTSTSIERGGGAHTVNHCREVELRRLGLLQ